MHISYNEISLNAELHSKFDPSKDTIILLHGFTGSAEDWSSISLEFSDKLNKIAVDLIGHGKSSSPNQLKYYIPESMADQLLTIINNLKVDKIILHGYSMGGRAALCFAAAYPERIKGLILESASAGIKNESERKKRIESDEKIADFITKNSTTEGLEKFVTNWMDQEIFGTLKRFSNKKLEEIKKKRMQNNPAGLSNSLRGFGTGMMPNIIPKLAKLRFPVLLISGGLDEKFTQINRVLKKSFAKAKHEIILTAGHNVHLEEPKKFVKAVNNFLNSL